MLISTKKKRVKPNCKVQIKGHLKLKRIALFQIDLGHENIDTFSQLRLR